MTQITTWGIVGLLGALLLSSGYAYIEREGRIAAVARAVEAEATAKQRGAQIASLGEELIAARRRNTQTEGIRRNVVAAPNSRACVDSPPIRAALRGPGPSGNVRRRLADQVAPRVLWRRPA